MRLGLDKASGKSLRGLGQRSKKKITGLSEKKSKELMQTEAGERKRTKARLQSSQGDCGEEATVVVEECGMLSRRG